MNESTKRNLKILISIILTAPVVWIFVKEGDSLTFALIEGLFVWTFFYCLMNPQNYK